MSQNLRYWTHVFNTKISDTRFFTKDFPQFFGVLDLTKVFVLMNRCPQITNRGLKILKDALCTLPPLKQISLNLWW